MAIKTFVMTFLIRFFIVYLKSTVVAAQQTCYNQSDCNDVETIQCGICVDSKVSGVGNCIFPFPDRFKGGQSCAIQRDCGQCNKRGKCESVYSNVITSCYCDEGYFGDNCELSIPKSIAVAIYRHMEAEYFRSVKPYYLNARPIFCFCRGEDKNPWRLYIELETYEGYYQSSYYEKDPCDVGQRVWHYSFSTAVRFPYKPWTSTSKEFLKLGNVVLGYLSTFKMQIKIPGIEEYTSRREEKVFVSYQETDLTCAPVIDELSGCASSRADPVQYVRSSAIEVSSDVYYVEDGRYARTTQRKPGCAASSKYKWTLWKYNREDKQASEKVKFDKKKVFYSPFELDIGRYKLLLETEVVQTKSAHNFAYCYFKIKSLPLVAVIEGGSEMTISRRFGIHLSAKGSGDPNMPPNKQGHVYATWTCENTQTNRDVCHATKLVTDYYIVPKVDLDFGVRYNITLKVWTRFYDKCEECDNISTAFANMIVNILSRGEESDNFIQIKCLGSNCGDIVSNNRPIVLQAKSNYEDDKYVWSFKEEGQIKEENITVIADQGLLSSLITIKVNSLADGKRYIIIARILGTKFCAKYKVEIEQVTFRDGSCSVEPSNGTKGETVFDVKCKNFGSGYTYEFFDKYEEDIKKDVIFSGRMLGTSTVGELRNVRLTRDVVCVYIVDRESGKYTYRIINMNLLPWKITGEIMGEIYRNLSAVAEEGDSSRTLRYVSFIPDIILEATMDKSHVLKTLLHFVTLVSIKSLADVKLTTSTLNNVLVTLNKPTQLGIDPELLRNTLKVTKEQATTFSNMMGEKESEQVKGQSFVQLMSPKEIREVATWQLNCLRGALLCRDYRTEGISEFEYDLKTLAELMQSTDLAEYTICSIQDILTYVQPSGQPPIRIATENNTFVTWVMKNDVKCNLTDYLNNFKDIPVSLPKQLLKSLQREAKENHLALQVTTIDDDMFWWCKSDVKSNFVSVSLAKQRKHLGYKHENVTNRLKKFKSLNSYISIGVTLRPFVVGTRFSGSVVKTDAENEDNELSIRIHRLDPTISSIVSLKFHFPETNNSLTVCVLPDFRPGIYEMKNKSKLITDQSPFYYFGKSLTFYQNRRKETYIYVGILPGPGVRVNQTVTYTFEVNTTLCQYWARGQWSSQGCKVLEKNDLEVTCECEHLSIFSVAFPVPPQEIDPFSDAKLFLNLLDNPIVVAFVTSVLFLYLFFCLLAWRKDKVDKKRRNIIVLGDNFPEDRFPYLLAVYTSSRFNAGTTANVGIKVSGDLAASRAHILTSEERKVLKTSFDDWFLVFCPEYLGTLQSIHIWHDNTGPSPEWFCSKIIVYDLYRSEQYVFVIEQWLALRINYFPEAKTFPSTSDETKTVKRLFLDNFIFGLQENHTLLSIILKHPRSETSRLQRISVFMCSLMTAMLCSIMFYAPPNEDYLPDDNRYGVELRDFYVSIQSLFISLVITFFVMLAFKRSHKKIKNVTRHSSSFKEIESFRHPSIAYSGFAKVVSETLKSKPLAPAQLPFSDPGFITRKKWLITAWVSCLIVIFACAWCVMLYGLKMGNVKSKKWLSSVFLTAGEDILLVTPVKVILFSVILAAVLQKFADEDTHSVTIKDLGILKNVQPNDESWIDKLVSKRSLPMYAPLQNEIRYLMVKQKLLVEKWWTLIDFSGAFCFIFVVSAVIFALWSSHFYSNNHIKNFMVDSHFRFLEGTRFYDIRYIEDLETYLKHSFFQTLYCTFWYNNKEINDPKGRIYWTEDFIHVPIGLQQLRQVRVTSKQCHLKFMITSKVCTHHWDSAYEEKDEFSPMWKQPEEVVFEEANTPWQYKEKSTSYLVSLFRLFGASGNLYKSGGYLTLLGPTKTDALKTVTELQSQDWQDELTRAVFIEFTVYNCNLDLFSQVTMIVEYRLAGSIKINVQVMSTGGTMAFSFWNVLFIIFVGFYIVRSGSLINRLGLMKYLESRRNISQLVIVLMGISCISLSLAHYSTSTSYYHQFVLSGLNTYFDFDTFIIFALALQLTLSVLLALAMFRTMLMFRGGRSLLNHVYLLVISINWIFWLTLMTLLVSLLQFPITFLLNILSLPSNLEMVIDPNSLKHLKTQNFERYSVRVFFFVKTCLVVVLMCCFITVFMYNAKIAKTYKLMKSDKFNLVRFVIKQLKTLLCKLKMGKTQ